MRLVGTIVTFSIPMIDNGMVYVGTTSSLVGYGMLTTQPNTPAAPSLLTAATDICAGGIELQWERKLDQRDGLPRSTARPMA